MGILVFIVVVVIVAIATVWIVKNRRTAHGSSPGLNRPGALDKTSTSEQSPNRLDDLNNDLILKVLGDRAKAKRLVEFERRKTPRNSEAEVVQAAIDRWERDNR